MLLELSWKHWIVPCSLMIPDPSVFNLSWKHWILPSPGHYQTPNVDPIGQNSQRSPDLDTPTHHELAHHDLAPPSPYQITNFDLTWTHQVKDVDCTVSLGLPLAVKVQELLLNLQSWGKCGLQHKLKSCKSLFRWPSLSCPFLPGKGTQNRSGNSCTGHTKNKLRGTHAGFLPVFFTVVYSAFFGRFLVESAGVPALLSWSTAWATSCYSGGMEGKQSWLRKETVFFAVTQLLLLWPKQEPKARRVFDIIHSHLPIWSQQWSIYSI